MFTMFTCGVAHASPPYNFKQAENGVTEADVQTHTMTCGFVGFRKGGGLVDKSEKSMFCT